MEGPAAVTLIVGPAAPVAEGLVQNRHPRLNRLRQTKIERLGAFEKAGRRQVHMGVKAERYPFCPWGSRPEGDRYPFRPSSLWVTGVSTVST